MDFDIAQFELNETATLRVQTAHGDGDLMAGDKPVEIVLYGPGSAEFAEAGHKQQNAATARLQAVMRGKQVGNQAQLGDKDAVAKLVACTASISENFPVEPQALYSNPRLSYIRQQVEAFLNDAANFSKASPTT